MELRGGKKFTIVRQLADPSDTNTYYVRGVITNSLTGSTIATVDLTDNGDQRFTYLWGIPYSPDETQIDIKTTVYTDSGYTTKSNRYAIESQSHIIRKTLNNMGGGAGGYSIDYKKIREIISKELTDKEIPDYKDKIQSLEDKLLLGLEVNRRAIDSIDIPTYDEKMLIEAIKNIRGYIESIEIPETDYKPIMSELEGLKQGIKESTKKLNDKSEELVKSHKGFKKSIEKIIDNVNENLDYIVKTFKLSELCNGFTQFMTGKKDEPSIKERVSGRLNNYRRPI